MDKSDKIEIVCSVETIRYHKDTWGIIIVSVDQIISGKPIMDKYKNIVLKGDMMKPIIGAMYHASAEYVEDPKWGGQYVINKFYPEIVFNEDDEDGKKKFLTSLFTPRQVENLYKTIEDPYRALDEADTKELVKVNGIGMITAVDMINKFTANKYLGKIFSELSEYNLTNRMVERLVERYKSPGVVIEKVKNNPYILADEVNGIGWAKADEIARDGGIKEDDPRRISAYIIKYLRDNGEVGRSWITTDELLGAILEALGEEIPDQKITLAIQDIKDKLWLSEDRTQIGLKYYYEMEHKVAEELIRLRDAEPIIKEADWSNWQSILHKMEIQQGWEFTQEQKNGIYLALSQNIVLITGMAGTGKSTLVTGILEVLKGHSYAQCALSGRAASRLSEITGKDGYTIHRLLRYNILNKNSKQGFTYHDDNQLMDEIYILDEISMVNTSLFYYLLRAIPSGAKLICLGDHGQLEAIGAGNIAQDMMVSPEVPTVTLTTIHRQAAASGIISEALKVRRGQQIIEKDWVGKDIRGELKDLELWTYSDASNTFYNIMAAFSAFVNNKDFNLMQTQILVPVKTKGNASTYELNNALQELVNPVSKRTNEITMFSNGRPYILREGDKVINTVNNYNTDPVIYNGNIGIIHEIDLDDDKMFIDFLGIGRVEIPRKYWGGIELGYAITIHKYQGSQADNIIIGLDFSGYSLLTRELVYTAITRAKKRCILIAQTGALRMATMNEGTSKKSTHLQQALYDVAHPKLVF